MSGFQDVAEVILTPITSSDGERTAGRDGGVLVQRLGRFHVAGTRKDGMSSAPRERSANWTRPLDGGREVSSLPPGTCRSTGWLVYSGGREGGQQTGGTCAPPPPWSAVRYHLLGVAHSCTEAPWKNPWAHLVLGKPWRARGGMDGKPPVTADTDRRHWTLPMIPARRHRVPRAPRRQKEDETGKPMLFSK